MNKFLLVVALLVSSVALAATPTTKTTATKPKTATMSTTESGTVKVVLTQDNMLTINDYFYGQAVANVSQKARELDSKLPAQDPLFLVINSGGGSIEAGIELIENLNRLNRPVHTITVFSASMGFQTVQGVKGKRLVQEEGTLMSHKAWGVFAGEFPGQLDSRYIHYLTRVQNLDRKVVARTNGKHTLQSYNKLIENEYWCDGRACISQGLADNVVQASCDSSLNGTHEVLWDRFIYMGHIIEIVDLYSNCPLITYELTYQIYVDGEPLFETYKDKKAEKEATKGKKEDYYSYRRIKDSALDDLTLETAENIRKLVQEKLDSRIAPSKAKRVVKKY
jgi:ATP-dependent protease ClpP protease subunit